MIRKTKEMAEEMRGKGMKLGIVATKASAYSGIDAEVVELGDSLEEVAKNLFSSLRDLDKRGVDIIIAEGVEEKGLGIAVMNRLKKASGHRFYRV